MQPKNLVRFTHLATSDKDMRPTLQNAYWNSETGELAATDSWRLHVAKIKGVGPDSCFVDRHGNPVSSYTNWHMNDRKYIQTKYKGTEFPKYDSFFDVTNHVSFVNQFNIPELRKIVMHLKKLFKDKDILMCTIELSTGKIYYSNDKENRYGEEYHRDVFQPVSPEIIRKSYLFGDRGLISVNPSYLLDALKYMGKHVTVYVKSELSQLVFEDTNAKALIMPIKRT